MTQKRQKTLFWIVLLLGVAVRMVLLGVYPVGLQQDEASAGYEAWSLMKYGIDRHGLSYPVHFISWGSGQNALYSYLCIPFIAVIGLNAVSVRLPMALVGCLSLPVFYYIIKKIWDEKSGLLGMFLLAVNPWHIMKSRWSIESNLFPDMVLLFVAVLLWALTVEKPLFWKRQLRLCAASSILSLALYSYGTSYFFIPIFLFSLLLLLLWKRELVWKELILPGILFLVLALPIFLFVVINTFDFPQLQLGGITIPRLYVSRHTEMAAVFSEDALHTMFQNFKDSVKILLRQTDAFAEHSIGGIGLFYLFGLPFVILGATVSLFFGKWSIGSWIFHIWGVLSGFMMLMVTPNITRLNICWFALLYFNFVGIRWVLERRKKLLPVFLGGYLLSFAYFQTVYYTSYQERIGEAFAYDIKGALDYCFEKGCERIHMSSQVMGSYAYCLFYSQTDPYEFMETVRYQEGHEEFQTIDGFGKFYMGIPEDLSQEGAAYIVRNDRLERMNLEGCEVKQFENYSVVRYLGKQ